MLWTACLETFLASLKKFPSLIVMNWSPFWWGFILVRNDFFHRPDASPHSVAVLLPGAFVSGGSVPLSCALDRNRCVRNCHLTSKADWFIYVLPYRMTFGNSSWKESLLTKYFLIFSCNCILRSHLQVLEVYLTMASVKAPQTLLPVFLTAELDHEVGELVYVVKRLELMGLEGAQFVPWRSVGRS